MTLGPSWLLTSRELSDEEIARHFARWLDAERTILPWLAEQTAAAGVDLASDGESLDALTRWVADSAERHDDDLPFPDWFGSQHHRQGMGSFGANALDGLIHHVAGIIKQATGAQWALGRQDRELDASARLPVLRVGEHQLGPAWRIAINAVGGYWKRGVDPNLGPTVQQWIDRAREQSGGSDPDLADAFGLWIEPLPGTPHNARLEWDDELRSLLGDRLDPTVDQVLALPGIVDHGPFDGNSVPLVVADPRSIDQLSHAASAIGRAALDTGPQAEGDRPE